MCRSLVNTLRFRPSSPVKSPSATKAEEPGVIVAAVVS